MSTLPLFLTRESDPPAKRAVMASALRRFVIDGFDATTVRAIADGSGFTNPALFRHFDSKEALAVHLFEACYRHLAASVAPPASGRFAARLETVLRRYLRALEASPEAVLYVQDNLRRFWPLMPAELRTRSLLGDMRALVESGRAEGAVGDEVDSRMAAGAILGMLAQFARMTYFGELDVGGDGLLKQLLRMTTKMLK